MQITFAAKCVMVHAARRDWIWIKVDDGWMMVCAPLLLVVHMAVSVSRTSTGEHRHRRSRNAREMEACLKRM